MKISRITLITSPITSLSVKYRWKGIRSQFEFKPSGLFEPISCSINRCIVTINRIENGSRKWSTKNRFSVGPETANPPHSHSTS